MAPAGRPPGDKTKVREEGKNIEKYMTGEETETKNGTDKEHDTETK